MKVHLGSDWANFTEPISIASRAQWNRTQEIKHDQLISKCYFQLLINHG